MERNVFDIFGTTQPYTGEAIPIIFAGIGSIVVPKWFIEQSGVSLIPGQDVIAGLCEDGIIMDIAPSPRASELEVV